MSALNDPRVLFAAERTLLAWNRTSVALIAFGFVIERSAIFARELIGGPARADTPGTAWIGLAFVVLGTVLAVLSTIQYERTLRTLRRADVPRGYYVHLPVFANIVVALLGVALAIYLLWGSRVA